MKTQTPITWKTCEPATPEDFPCLICKKREALVMTEVKNNGLELNLPLCVFCSGMPEQHLIYRALAGK